MPGSVRGAIWTFRRKISVSRKKRTAISVTRFWAVPPNTPISVVIGIPYQAGCCCTNPWILPEEVPEEVEWWDYSEGYGFGPLLISVELEGGISLQFNYIANSSAGTYAVGQTLDLNLVRVDNDHAPGTDVSWYFDDEPVSGEVTFTRAGRHTLEARFTTVAGRRKIVELEITVE